MSDDEKIANGICLSDRGFTPDRCRKCIDVCYAFHFKIEVDALKKLAEQGVKGRDDRDTGARPAG